MRRRTILKSILLIILGVSVTFSQENNEVSNKDTLTVDKKVKKPLLLNDVKYDASDSIIINQKDNKIILYNNAKIVYGDIELTSGLIILDYKKNEIYAGRIADKDGNLSQYPVFKEGFNTVNPDSIKYNFNTQKALIWNSKSEENESDDSLNDTEEAPAKKIDANDEIDTSQDEKEVISDDKPVTEKAE